MDSAMDPCMHLQIYPWKVLWAHFSSALRISLRGRTCVLPQRRLPGPGLLHSCPFLLACQEYPVWLEPVAYVFVFDQDCWSLLQDLKSLYAHGELPVRETDFAAALNEQAAVAMVAAVAALVLRLVVAEVDQVVVCFHRENRSILPLTPS